ncbi:MAG TPA: hypothetical protein PKC13_10145 [Blastocatellia bacterium]|nr:hypothetical protein [Blastocatellia bacterium]HMX25950.1 hypothetical protein [Blastocatellia bacterium]HNG32116.1 hypothetical protein [Blastocatellia bacterium]
MLLKGRKNSIAAATVMDRAANLACWQPSAAVSFGILPGTFFNSVTMTPRDSKRANGQSVRTPESLVGGYLFSHQR